MPAVRFVAFEGKSLISRMIRFVTRSQRYSHIAYLSTRGQLIECWPSPENKFQRWVISSFDDHKAGTYHELWELPVSNHIRHNVDKFFTDLVFNNTKYDWYGVIGFVLKRIVDVPERLFCSEGCVTPLVENLGWTKVNPAHVSPQDFVELIQVAGGHCLTRGKT